MNAFWKNRQLCSVYWLCAALAARYLLAHESYVPVPLPTIILCWRTLTLRQRVSAYVARDEEWPFPDYRPVLTPRYFRHISFLLPVDSRPTLRLSPVSCIVVSNRRWALGFGLRRQAQCRSVWCVSRRSFLNYNRILGGYHYEIGNSSSIGR
jgi:hypothetical protein